MKKKLLLFLLLILIVILLFIDLHTCSCGKKDKESYCVNISGGFAPPCGCQGDCVMKS